LLKNGVKEAVRNSGITLRFFHPRESKTGLKRTGSPPAQDPGGAKGRIGIRPVGISGCRNGEKC
jgi:hypothetical protein